MRALTVALALLVMSALALPAQAQNRFWLQNNTGQTIEEAYVSPSRLSNWGPDILGQGVLPPGQQVRVSPYFSDCVLDVRVRYAGGREETRMGLNACNLDRIAFGGGGAGGAITSPRSGGGATAGNPSFSFINQSGQVIRELYVSLSSQSSWGRDRLGDNMLAPGQSMPVSLPTGGGCEVDIRVVYNNGAASERRNLSTCALQSIQWR